MGECTSCYNTSCPEVVAVTINQNSYTIDSVGLTIALVQDSATQVTLTITSDVADFVNLNCYFIDNPAIPDEKTISGPPTPGWVEQEFAPNSSGVATLVVSNTGATDTWYLVIKGLNGVLVISDAITIGV